MPLIISLRSSLLSDGRKQQFQCQYLLCNVHTSSQSYDNHILLSRFHFCQIVLPKFYFCQMLLQQFYFCQILLQKFYFCQILLPKLRIFLMLPPATPLLPSSSENVCECCKFEVSLEVSFELVIYLDRRPAYTRTGD